MKATESIKIVEENLGSIRIGGNITTGISEVRIALYLYNWIESSSFWMLSSIDSEIYFKWQQKAIF